MPQMAYWYPTEEAEWIAWAVSTNTGFTVVVNPTLDHACLVDQGARTIEIQAGLTWPQFRRTLSNAALHARFPGLKTGFHPSCHLGAFSPGGIVVPLAPRRQYRYPTAS
jgi:hypothetical protein